MAAVTLPHRLSMPSHLRRRLALFVSALVVLPLARAAAQDASPQYSTVFGGSGGDAFTRDCGAGRVLAGIRGRSGLYVDAIGIICRPVNADGTLGSPTAAGTLVGGSGGTATEAICPSYAPAMIGFTVKYGSFVDVVVPACGEWNWVARTFSYRDVRVGGVGNFSSMATSKYFQCSSKGQPGAGIRGRAKALVDAIGMICDEP